MNENEKSKYKIQVFWLIFLQQYFTNVDSLFENRSMMDIGN